MTDNSVVSCPNCSKKLNVPSSAIGKKARCNGCQQVIQLQENVFRKTTSGASGIKQCVSCGKNVLSSQNKCNHCGGSLASNASRNINSLQNNKFPVIAAIAAVSFCSLLLIAFCVIFFFWGSVPSNNKSIGGNTTAAPPVVNSIGIELRQVQFSNANEAEKHEWHRGDSGQLDTARNSSGDFFLGTFEITESQFKKVMPDIDTDWWFQEGDNLPALVTWDHAQEFCFWLSELPEEKANGRWYRLPTDAEWVYAAYADGKGDLDPDRLAWHSGNSGKKKHPVGTKEANPWGFYDMLGNAREWVQNAPTKEDPFWQTGEKTDPNANIWISFQGNGRERVVMGGAYTTAMKLSKVDSAILKIANERYEKITGNKRDLPVDLWNLKRQKNYDEVVNAQAGFRVVMVEGTLSQSQAEANPTSPNHPFRRRKADREADREAELRRKAEREEEERLIEEQGQEKELWLKVEGAKWRPIDLRELPRKIFEKKKLLKEIAGNERYDTLRRGLEEDIQKMETKMAKGLRELPQSIAESKKLLKEIAKYEGPEWQESRRALEEGIQEMETKMAEESNPSSLESKADPLMEKMINLNDEIESMKKRQQLGSSTRRKTG